MSDQIVKDQVENKINLIAEVDNIIISICKKVTNAEMTIKDYSQVVNALAKLVSARALVDYASKFCADLSPVSDSKNCLKEIGYIFCRFFWVRTGSNHGMFQCSNSKLFSTIICIVWLKCHGILLLSFLLYSGMAVPCKYIMSLEEKIINGTIGKGKLYNQ